MLTGNVPIPQLHIRFEIKNHSKNIELHQFVVMPNHIHGILQIVENINNGGEGVDDGVGVGVGRDVACNVSTNAQKKLEGKNKNNN